ncbi:hypothetical protein B0H16DRAFT_1736347 [Mycena metata]|uniref:TEA domain-containing protein n=1 Tax=Mycena metata TaxID=1033252 RepID=A0AAD7HPU5_9AGAR|nr:hypothetical protein B0H16DRAFT_1736347 [Mycena metata]
MGTGRGVRRRGLLHSSSVCLKVGKRTIGSLPVLEMCAGLAIYNEQYAADETARSLRRSIHRNVFISKFILETIQEIKTPAQVGSRLVKLRKYRVDVNDALQRTGHKSVEFQNIECGDRKLQIACVVVDLMESVQLSPYRVQFCYQLPSGRESNAFPPDAYIIVNRRRLLLDLDYCVHTRVVRVGSQGELSGLEFVRTTYFAYLPGPPRTLEDFTIPPYIDPLLPVETDILPPRTFGDALRAVASVTESSSRSLPTVLLRCGDTTEFFPSFDLQREESLIDLDLHPSDLFCAVFRKQCGAYQVALIFTSLPDGVVTTQSLIFAPSAWRHAAVVLAVRGVVDGSYRRLVCRLSDRRVILLDIECSRVDIEEQWIKEGYESLVS